MSTNNFFKTFFDNLIGQAPPPPSPAHHYTPAQIAQMKARKLAAQEARQERLAALHAAHPHAAAHHG